GSGSTGEAKHDSAGVGSVGLALQLLPGVTINTFNYSITGNGVSRDGTIDLTSSAPGSQFLVLGLPAASGYSIALSATSTDGAGSCNGSAPFSVSASSTTNVAVAVECIDSAGGPVSVSPTLNICPRATGLAAVPTPGSSSFSLTGTAVDRDNRPSPLSF